MSAFGKPSVTNVSGVSHHECFIGFPVFSQTLQLPSSGLLAWVVSEAIA
jgi:hypothetical protein